MVGRNNIYRSLYSFIQTRTKPQHSLSLYHMQILTISLRIRLVIWIEVASGILYIIKAVFVISLVVPSAFLGQISHDYGEIWHATKLTSCYALKMNNDVYFFTFCINGRGNVLSPVCPSVYVGLWDLSCAPPQRYRTTLCTTGLHHAPWCTRRTYISICEK